MPATLEVNSGGEELYYHVSNGGVEGRNIFCDQSDYDVFFGYLKEYLSEVADPESLRKSFVVKGNTFRGLPRQPKNYLNKVELLAYSLRPVRFHLLFRELSSGSVEKFMRSLCTRYSIYFNRKHRRKGSLFSGSYKFFKTNKLSCLSYLSYYLHRLSLESDRVPVLNKSSSYAEYLGLRKSPWVKSSIVLSLFDKSENDLFKGVNGYHNFVEKYELDQKEKDLLETMIFEKVDRIDKKIDFSSANFLREKQQSEITQKLSLGISEFLAGATIFLILFGLGIRNVWLTDAGKFMISPVAKDQTVLSATSSNPIDSASDSASLLDSAEPDPPKAMTTVKLTDGLTNVNIRQSPTAESEKIGLAQGGDVFEFVSENSGWYEIRLVDGSTGFVSADYAELFIEIKEISN